MMREIFFLNADWIVTNNMSYMVSTGHVKKRIANADAVRHLFEGEGHAATDNQMIALI
jgi:hypothetical protein